MSLSVGDGLFLFSALSLYLRSPICIRESIALTRSNNVKSSVIEDLTPERGRCAVSAGIGGIKGNIVVEEADEEERPFLEWKRLMATDAESMLEMNVFCESFKEDSQCHSFVQVWFVSLFSDATSGSADAANMSHSMRIAVPPPTPAVMANAKPDTPSSLLRIVFSPARPFRRAFAEIANGRNAGPSASDNESA